MSTTIKVSDDVKVTSILEAEGLSCPLPLLRTKKNLATLTSGDVLQIKGMYPNFLLDIQGWCERNGHAFLGEKEVYGKISFFVKKG